MVAALVKDGTLLYIDELLKATFRHHLIKQNNTKQNYPCLP